MTETVDVLIIGGGPAGLAAAEVTAAAGARTVLFDENAAAGGQLRYRLGDIRTESGIATFPPQLAKELTARAVAAGAEIRTGHRVWGIFSGRVISVEANGVAALYRADRLLLATGSVDRSLVFPGGSIPGVFTGRAVQILLNVHYVQPGKRFVIIADEPDRTELARAIAIAGGEVVGVLPVDASNLVAHGDQGVTYLSAAGFEREVDVVVVAAGRNADSGLAFMAECAAGYSNEYQGFLPKVDERLESSVAGIYLAGDCAGPTTPEIALLEGAFAGASIAASLGRLSAPSLDDVRQRYATAAAERIAALADVAGSYVQVDRLPLGEFES